MYEVEHVPKQFCFLLCIYQVGFKCHLCSLCLCEIRQLFQYITLLNFRFLSCQLEGNGDILGIKYNYYYNYF